MSERIIAIPIFEDLQTLDVSGPAEVFATANFLAKRAVYSVQMVASRPGPISTPAGLQLLAQDMAALLAEDIHTLIVPGGEAASLTRAAADPVYMHWLHAAANQAPRVCSVCSGTLLLAATGVLNGRRATTHWDGLTALRQLYPQIVFDDVSLYVEDGRYWTSAGVTAGIDLCLALVAKDCGHQLAMRVAKRLVVYKHRPSSQQQIRRALGDQMDFQPWLSRLAAWIEDNLATPLTVEAVAATAGVAPRTLHRKMVADCGKTPAKFVEEVRLHTVRKMLSLRDRDLRAVATQTGYSSSDQLIRAFSKRFGITPGKYRQTQQAGRLASP